MILNIKNELESMTSKEKVALLSYIMADEHVSVGDVAFAIGCSVIDEDDLVSELIDRGLASDPLDDEDCSAYGIVRSDCTSDLSFVSTVLEAMPPYELKKALCDALWVGTYCDNKALEERLKDIINA
jgi:hypothetical protein